ncbi:hypothetical protein GUITHDRAFT_164638 [Guillardia theta CCMP2712]|uniref:Uncharacterized protein n=1 Tax=Guillardia theta (strain CCMP2712) TaxID=905079 RepID=L1IWD4_GUITC|nr:hypothetical protein GUITHDRAFT_164638 [Guillardia theta CCMP2712]EKX40578.1 hypothetical protein GUITHDRAFT_164638 [Guillardia theta CCMP2712]|mmetsp:Transcript_25898/g.85270  ORF Transcript_25898/g.85270 Transcript_25898/m.85270 type:complete len:198 (-) Transcript_25898:198-791(-)|eukprot:XP_005827558.1 hypothetical protein GUITHDRAFT_164638 [Guillardia theta CCMP2712]
MVYRPSNLISRQTSKSLRENLHYYGAEAGNVNSSRAMRRARPHPKECAEQETGSFLLEAYSTLLKVCKRTDEMLNQEMVELSDDCYSSDDTTSDDVSSIPREMFSYSAANVLAEFVGSRVENVCSRMQDALRVKSTSSFKSQKKPCGSRSVFMPFIGSTVDGKFHPGFETFDPSHPVLPPPRGLYSTAVIYEREDSD